MDPRQTLATIIHTIKIEEDLCVGTSYKNNFIDPERRRTENACLVFTCQILSRSSFAYNTTYFFEQVGLDFNTTYELNVGGTGMALVGTLIFWFTFMPYSGRRTIYLWGVFTMTAILFTIGFLKTHTSNSNVGMSQAVLTLV